MGIEDGVEIRAEAVRLWRIRADLQHGDHRVPLQRRTVEVGEHEVHAGAAETGHGFDAVRRVFGYTIGNDMSSRSIEGANPLYLPQAKIYDGGCALGPCLLVADEPLDPSTEIALRVGRRGTDVYRGSAQLSQMRRTPEELVSFLYRECSFPNGCYLLTGTGIVPEGDFTLATGDEIEITIEPIGTLRNRVSSGARRSSGAYAHRCG